MISRMFMLVVTMALITLAHPVQAAEPRVPTVEDLLNLRTALGSEISPDGRWVAYRVSQPDFEQNTYISHIWLADTETGDTFQLTRGDKSTTGPQWSPDGQWLTFLSTRVGGKRQLFAIRPIGGEAVQLTEAENGVGGYAWSKDGTKIAFTASEPEPQAMKDRKAYMSNFNVIRKDYTHTHLWAFDTAAAMKKPEKGVQLTKGRDFSINGFAWSPDGAKIAFSATVNPDLTQGHTSDLYMLNLADSTVTSLVSQPGPDRGPVWSPDGTQIAFTTYMGQERYYASNSELAIIPASGGTPRVVTQQFDENPFLVKWHTDGMYIWGRQKTASHLFRLNPSNGNITRITGPDDLMAFGFTISDDGRRTAFRADSPTSMFEVYVADMDNFKPKRLTRMTDQAKDFILGTREVISWKSKDGTVIEGVLIKPKDFDPNRKYPLLVRIHGGPTGIDRPGLLTPDMRYYPADIWAERGALMLKVNYRGSAGYGEKFRKLNMNNLGVGDAWDVLSGVQHLIDKGWVDADKVASMGWSQGGYISAFLTTSSDRFAAISVGAGISNWATYYYNTDITPFTINYLGDDPVDDPEIYEKTSPMSYIRQAKTPTLIQHGEFDRRVPVANAYELRQGLEDRGVPVEMIVYNGFGHGINKPKSMRAVMHHNLGWFNHYLWGDPLPDFTTPEVPEEDEE